MNTPFVAHLSTVRANRFRGVDLSSPPESVDSTRSPDAPNIMPGADKKPTKRPGFSKTAEFGGKINGIFPFKSGGTEHMIIHAGQKLFFDTPNTRIYSAAQNTPSAAVQFGDNLYFFDGSSCRIISPYGSAATQSPLRLNSYTPTITIGRKPSGGGVPFEDFNLISRKFTEEFSGTADDTAYQLSFDGLLSISVVVEVLDKASTANKKIWNTLTSETDFTVDYTNGIVNFVEAPGVSSIEGEDNVRITAYKSISEYFQRIEHCTVIALYGVGGVCNRLFVSGNPDYPGVDWYSEMDDPTYFGESHYCTVAPNCDIVGYSLLDGLLAAHCSGGREAPVVLRSGEMMEGEAAFPIKNILRGAGACSKRGFGVLGEEPLFLTESGVFALTAKDATGERYLQRRSWFIDKALCAENGLEHAVFCPWKSFMLIAVNGKVYLLDGGQKTYEQAAPYSTFQYECYYWTDIPAKSMAVVKNILCFGDSAGNLYAFHEPEAISAEAYTDCGKAIGAHWDLPDITGTNFYDRKALRAVYAELAPQPRTSVRVLFNYNGVWQPLWQEGAAFRYFRWSGIKWSEFVWQCDDKSRSYGRRRLVPGLGRIRIRFENSVAGEPFGLNSAAVEFTETGKKCF